MARAVPTSRAPYPEADAAFRGPAIGTAVRPGPATLCLSTGTCSHCSGTSSPVLAAADDEVLDSLGEGDLVRIFNTSGPNDPAKHYTLGRPALLAQGRRYIEESRYFTVFAPRQSGKSTFFAQLAQAVEQDGRVPLYLNFESYGAVGAESFFKRLSFDLNFAFACRGLTFDVSLDDFNALSVALRKDVGRVTGQRPLVLVIDEIEGLTNVELLDGFLHTVREVYHTRAAHAVHSVVLCGVGNMVEVLESAASPFNIADQLELPYFTFDEVRELLGQHTDETGQVFAPEVAFQIHHYTQGQPGLVNAMARRLVTHDRADGAEVCIPDFYRCLDWFLTESIDKNLANVVAKALEKRDTMYEILYSVGGVDFTVHDPDLRFLFVHGLIEKDADGKASVRVPLYQSILVSRLKATVNGEARQFLPEGARDRYLLDDGTLDMDALLTAFRDYVCTSGYRAFQVARPVTEAVGQICLEGFLNFAVRQIFGGYTMLEAPAGRGRIDIMVFLDDRMYLIETKLRRSPRQVEQGRLQAAEYARAIGLDHVWYVVFDAKTSSDDAGSYPQHETVDGVVVSTHVVSFDPMVPSHIRTT